MKRKSLISMFVSFTVAAATFSVYAAQTAFPIVEILGTKYYLYESKKGDTLFGIARANGWNDKELQRLNPSAISPLKKGVKIYYPVNDRDVAAAKPEVIAVAPKTEVSHVVKKGETVYSISQLYNIPVETIYSLNRSSRNGIKPGETLLLCRQDAGVSANGEEDAGEERFYTVKPGDTVYEVSRLHGITVAALLKSNPGISDSSFQAGSVIRIPARGTGVRKITKTEAEPVVGSFEIHEVGKNETWSSIASAKGVDVGLLKESNPDAGERLKKNQTIGIPKLDSITVERTVVSQDPRELSDKGIREIYEDVHHVSEEKRVKVAIVAETTSSNKDVEFIRGFLTGIDELKDRSYKIDLKVIDGTKGQEGVVEELKGFIPTLVFITYDRNVPAYICEYASENRIPVVNTFDVKSEEYTSNPYFVQLLTPSNYFNDCVASNVYEKFGDHQLVFIGEEDPGDQLAAALRKYWKSASVTSAPQSDPESITVTDGGKYVFYGYTTKKAEVQTLLQNVYAVKEEVPFADFVVLGRPNWIVFDSSLAEELHKVNTVIPSRFYLDQNSEEARHFTAAYKSLFNRNPVKSLPLYSGVGYDTAMYFIPAMAENGGDINTITSSTNTVQSEFSLDRVSNWGGFINPPVYLVRFTPFDTIDKIVIE